MSERRYARCQDCGARITLPRWAADGIPWVCMGCTGESPRELIEWARDAKEADAEQREIDEEAFGDPACVRDDSTECNCSRCAAGEGEFWRDQGEATL